MQCVLWVFGLAIMEVKVGYCPWIEKNPSTMYSGLNFYGWIDHAHFEPEQLDTWRGSDSRFHQCPAFSKFIRQFYVIRNMVDIELSWDKTNKVLSSNLSYEHSQSFVRLHGQDFNLDTGYPIVALSNSFVFVADVDVYVEVFPPFNHIDNSWRIIPGSFNIGKWQRPVITTIEMLEDRVSIKRGQPIAYARFRTDNLKDKIKLEQIPRSEKLEHIVNSSLTLKHYIPKISWKIQETFNRLKPKSWFK